MLICGYSSPLLECGYSCYHPASPCHHIMAILAAVQLLLPSCNCSCCPAAIPTTMWLFCCHAAINCCPVAILATMPLFLPQCGYFCCHAAINCCHVDIFLLQCSYSRHNVAILAAMQPLIVAMWIYSCCNASYSRHHEAILAAMQLFLPQCGYFCCHAAINCCHVAILAVMQPLIVAMWIIYSNCNASYSHHHEAILAAMHAAIPATMWLFLLPCSH